MKILIPALLILTLLPCITFSQSPDSLFTGKKYKITLFSEKEITGRLISQSDSTVTLKNENVTATVYRRDILAVSIDLSPSKYKYLATLNGGYVANNYYIGYHSNFIINARFSYFYSEKKSLGADFTYTSFAYDDENENYGADYKGGKQSYFDLLLNAQIGTFEKSNDVDAYANVGAGVHVSSRTSSTITYYSISNSGYFTNTNPSSTRFYAAMQLGGGLIIKPTYNIGINLEADMVAYFSGVTIVPTEAYFPVKAGVSYYFMK